VDDAFWQNAIIPEKKLPVFIFNIKMQEIHCMVHKITKKIMDGDVDRLMSMDFRFALTLHDSPDLEIIGHKWEIIELQPT
jgi:hypothetical protein